MNSRANLLFGYCGAALVHLVLGVCVDRLVSLRQGLPLSATVRGEDRSLSVVLVRAAHLARRDSAGAGRGETEPGTPPEAPRPDTEIPVPEPDWSGTPPARSPVDASTVELEAVRGPAAAKRAPVFDDSVRDADSTPAPVVRPTASIAAAGLAPRYPLSARLDGEEGVVGVDVWIDARGRVIRASVSASSGYTSLDRAALRAVRAARFESSGNRSAETRQVGVSIRFSLTD